MILAVLALLLLSGGIIGEKFELEAQGYNYGNYGKGECFTIQFEGDELGTGLVKLLGPADPTYLVHVSIYGDDGSQPISYKITENESDFPFSFKANSSGTSYSLCFRASLRPGKTPNVPNSPPIKIPIFWKFRPKNDNFDQIKALDELKPLEAEFFRLQGVDDDMATFLKNEESMRDVNESSLEKVTWFSIASILFLIGLGLFELFHLKGFFIAKKLI
jgi:hypothetical protein